MGHDAHYACGAGMDPVVLQRWLLVRGFCKWPREATVTIEVNMLHNPSKRFASGGFLSWVFVVCRPARMVFAIAVCVLRLSTISNTAN